MTILINMSEIKEQLAKIVSKKTNHKVEVGEFSAPPNKKLGDLALACFSLGKELKKNPAEVAQEMKAKFESSDLIEGVEATGPYLNFKLKPKFIAENVLLKKQKPTEKRGKIMIEFAHPNTHKAFHIGHLRNIITGESICRILDNYGYKVVRANYQGDVGMHIAKCLWGIEQKKDAYEQVKDGSIEEKVKFLGEVYALGGQTYEKDEEAKKLIQEINAKIYAGDKDIKDVYETTRQWSLDYFNAIYKRVNTTFDRFYFESQTFVRGKKLVEKFLSKGVFTESEGAVIFEGEKYGLHSRVFINSAGLPTYEAKDVALAEMQMKEYKPERIIHVVGKEQTEYFKVVFRALEEVLPKTKGKQEHLAYGWVSLKSGKMSSRTGKVVLGEWLLEQVKEKISTIMKESELSEDEKTDVLEKVTVGAVKYAMLKLGVKVDMAFDIDESISLSGNSGPYLLYICARIQSILNKLDGNDKVELPQTYEDEEKNLLLLLSQSREAFDRAAESLDPSEVAKYLFDLAQTFNDFYNQCPVVKADDGVKGFRVSLIKKVQQTMQKGLNLLGIEHVERM